MIFFSFFFLHRLFKSSIEMKITFLFALWWPDVYLYSVLTVIGRINDSVPCSCCCSECDEVELSCLLIVLVSIIWQLIIMTGVYRGRWDDITPVNFCGELHLFLKSRLYDALSHLLKCLSCGTWCHLLLQIWCWNNPFCSAPNLVTPSAPQIWC